MRHGDGAQVLPQAPGRHQGGHGLHEGRGWPGRRPRGDVASHLGTRHRGVRGGDRGATRVAHRRRARRARTQQPLQAHRERVAARDEMRERASGTLGRRRGGAGRRARRGGDVAEIESRRREAPGGEGDVRVSRRPARRASGLVEHRGGRRFASRVSATRVQPVVRGHAGGSVRGDSRRRHAALREGGMRAGWRRGEEARRGEEGEGEVPRRRGRRVPGGTRGGGTRGAAAHARPRDAETPRAQAARAAGEPPRASPAEASEGGEAQTSHEEGTQGDGTRAPGGGAQATRSRTRRAVRGVAHGQERGRSQGGEGGEGDDDAL